MFNTPDKSDVTFSMGAFNHKRKFHPPLHLLWNGDVLNFWAFGYGSKPKYLNVENAP